MLLRFLKQDSVDHATALQVLEEIGHFGHTPCVVPQCIYEMFVVATRPLINNGLGLKANEVQRDIDDLLETLVLLVDVPEIFNHWRDLTLQFSVSGKPAHDARIVASMQVHRVTALVTFNHSDFKRYVPLINVIDPRSEIRFS